MDAEFDIQSYMEALQERLDPFLKDRFFPSGPVDRLIDDLLEEYDASDEEITDVITPAFRSLGLLAMDVDEDDYLVPGAGEEEISAKLIGMIEKNNLDADMVYFLGTDDFSRKHEKLFSKMVNLVYFAVETLQLSTQVITHTHQLLRMALEAHHLRLYPHDAERCRGWVDEETIDIAGPFLKHGHIPGWVYDDVLRDLVAELGDYPLSQNVLDLSLDAMGAKRLLLPKAYWLPAGSSEESILSKLFKLFSDRQIDLDRCFAEGLQFLPVEIQELSRNIVFFGDANAATLYQAGLTSDRLLARLVEDDHAKRHPDERITTDVVNHDMAMTLRTHAKGGYVPSFVVSSEYHRLLQLTRNAANAAAIRDGTMASLSLQSLTLSADMYLSPGTPGETICEAVLSHVSGWDLAQIYETGAVPGDYAAAHNSLVSMIFFAANSIQDLPAANALFWDCLLFAVRGDRRVRGKDVPEQVLLEIETVCRQWQKNRLIPSFLRRAAIDTLLSYVNREWYADCLYSQILARNGIEEIDVDGPDYLAPQDAARLDAHVDELIAQYGFDLDDISGSGVVREQDAQKRTLLSNVLYFAVYNLNTLEDAASYADQLLLDYARRMQGRRRRMRQPRI